MNKTKLITNQQEQQVLNLQGQLKAKDIALKVGVTIHQVYEVFKRYKTTNKQNQTFELNTLQEQIILSGIIGDGRLKKNGKNNYYYSECHSLKESEYLEWKYKMLGELTANNKIYNKNFNNKHTKALEFTTKTTPTLVKYAEMTKEQVISKLNELGILLLILDDGWYSNNCKLGRISVGMKNKTDRHNFIQQCKLILGIEPYEVGIKRVDISISSVDCKVLLDVIKKYNMFDLDIVVKKFNVLKEHYGY